MFRSDHLLRRRPLKQLRQAAQRISKEKTLTRKELPIGECQLSIGEKEKTLTRVIVDVEMRKIIERLGLYASELLFKLNCMLQRITYWISPGYTEGVANCCAAYLVFSKKYL